MITYPISSNFFKKIFSIMFSALQYSWSMNLGSFFIEYFLSISFQKKIKIQKGNTQMKFKYLLFWLESCIDFKRNLTDGNLIKQSAQTIGFKICTHISNKNVAAFFLKMSPPFFIAMIRRVLKMHFYLKTVNSLMHNISKWSDTL